MSIYDYKVKDLKENDVSLNAYKGKVLLIVNTATQCGLTPQYTGLQALYEKYKDQGLEILDFPSNQFNNQAPGTSEEIHAVCTGRFGITFKQFAKIDVNGETEAPLYTYLKSQKRGRFGKNIKWNFAKFLVNKEGVIVHRFAPTTSPDKIDAYIKKIL
ncbi:MAG: glutathione peroxidase [Candidatus Izemoplasmataceae bacterium]|uniref:glutathione peroxidase n=1 Tax=Liberiplasma polymorphum TaxID=3374570 RepID=UPI0037757D12